MWYSSDVRVAPGRWAAVLVFVGVLVLCPSSARTPRRELGLYDRSAYAAGREALSKGDVSGAATSFCGMFGPAGKGDLWTLSVMLLCHPENISSQVASLSPLRPVFVQEVEFNGLRCYRVCAGLARQRSGLNAMARALKRQSADSHPFPVKVIRPCGPGRPEPEISGDGKPPIHHPAYLGPPVREPAGAAEPGGSRSAGKTGAPGPRAVQSQAPATREGEVLFQEGVQAYNAGHLEEAERYYRRSLEVEPGRAEVLNNLGVLYLKRGECARARSLFERALKQSPDYASAHLNLAGALWGLGKKDDALQEAREAVVLDPRSVNGYLTLASFYLSTGDKTAAGGAARKALLLEPGNEQARIFLSASQKKNGD